MCFDISYRAALHFTSAVLFNLNVQEKTVLLVWKCFKVCLKLLLKDKKRL